MRKNLLSVLIVAAGIAVSPSMGWAAQAGSGSNGGGANAGNPGNPATSGQQGIVGNGGAKGTTINRAAPNNPTLNQQPNTTGGAPSALPPGCTRMPEMINGVQRCD